LYLPYWEQHPPLHLLVAAYLGVKPSGKKAKMPDNREAIADLAKHGSFLPGAGWGTGDPHEGLRAPILNFEELKRHYNS
jgi:hypothetical protein